MNNDNFEYQIKMAKIISWIFQLIFSTNCKGTILRSHKNKTKIMSLHFKKDTIFNELSFIISVLFFNQYILETKMRKGEAVVTLLETKTKSQRNSTKKKELKHWNLVWQLLYRGTMWNWRNGCETSAIVELFFGKKWQYRSNCSWNSWSFGFTKCHNYPSL